MPRTAKNRDAKREALLAQIWRLFLVHGYQDTTLALILGHLHISKGVFYHYFDSKEGCAKLAAEFYAKTQVKIIEERCQAIGLSDQEPIEQLKTLITQGQALFAENSTALGGLNSTANRVFHQMLMVGLTVQFSTLYGNVIAQGVSQGQFQTAHPYEFAEMFLALSHFYLDADLFGWPAGQLEHKLAAFFELLSKGLNLPETHLITGGAT